MLNDSEDLIINNYLVGDYTMKLKKDSDLEILKQGAQLGGGVAAGQGLKGALNSILSGKAGAVAKMLPKALGRSTGAGAVAASLVPEDISAGSTEAERKLEMGEPMSEEDYAQLEAMKFDANRAMQKGPTPEERKSSRNLLNKWVIGKEIDDEIRAEEAQDEAQEEPMDTIPQEDDGGVDPEEARKMKVDELLKKLRMHNI
jgi:hypothetical protein